MARPGHRAGRPQADLGYEGSHLYKHDGRYYVLTCHFPQGKGKTEACLMAESLDGAFEVREIIDDDLSFHGYGVAQGGMVDTPDGDWYAFMMQDRGGVGRVPILMPMRVRRGRIPRCRRERQSAAVGQRAGCKLCRTCHAHQRQRIHSPA